MAQDLSGVRARPTQLRRSAGVQTPDRGPTTTLQAATPARPTAVNPGSFFEGAMPGFQQALQNFGQAAQVKNQMEQEQAKMKARLDNAEMLENFRREVMTNFEGVKEAVSTGDFSKLPFKVGDMLSRDVVRNNLHSMIGKQQAYEDLPGLKEELDQVSDPMVLNDVIQKYVALQTQGVQSDFYATAYGETLIAAGRKMAEARRENIAEAGVAKTKEMIHGNLVREYGSPANTWTLQGTHEMQSEIAAGLMAAGVPPEQAFRDAAAMSDKAMIYAAYDNPRLDDLLDMPDPSRHDGLSIRDRYPGLVEETIAARETAYRTETNAEARRRIKALEDEIAVFGDPERSKMSLADMSSELFHIENNYRTDTNEYQRVYAKYKALYSSTVGKAIDISLWKQGHFVAMDAETFNKQSWAAYQSLGLMSPEERANATTIWAQHGFDPKTKQHLEMMLDGPPEMFQQAQDFLMAVKDVSPHKDYNELVSPVEAGKLVMYEYMTEAGFNRIEVREDAAAVTENNDPLSYFDKQALASKQDGRGIGTQQGRRGSWTLATEAWDTLDMGVGNLADQPPELQRMMMDAVNISAYSLRDVQGGGDIKKIRTGAARIAQNQLTLGADSDGQTIAQLANGSLIPRAANPEVLKVLQDNAERFGVAAEAYNDATPNGPQIVATKRDPRSVRGAGELVMIDHGDGRPTPAIYSTEQVFAVPAEDIPQALRDSDLLVSVGEEHEGVFNGYIRPGVDGEIIPMENGFQLVYEGHAAGWTMRFLPPGQADGSVNIEDVVPLSNTQADAPALANVMANVRNSYAAEAIEAEVKAGRITREKGNELLNAMSTINRAADLSDEAATFTDVINGLQTSTTAEAHNMPVKMPMTNEQFVETIMSGIEEARVASFNEVGERPGFRKNAGAFIFANENVRLQSYQDEKTRSIGYGFNLQRDDAKELIENLGYDYDKVYKGEQAITLQDAKKLRDVVIQSELNTLRQRMKNRKIDPGTLKDHQLVALLSMHWQGPSIISTKIYNALRSGDHKKVEQLIRESTPTYKGRRSREADLYAGKLSLDIFIKQEKEAEAMPNFGKP